MRELPLIVIAGTTASGKSDLAVELALQAGGEVVSCDSVQCRKGMDIGSGKITEAEMRGVPHWMLDVCGVRDEYNVALYQRQALGCISDIRSRGHVPILCGGTGLFLNAVIYPMNLEDGPAPDPAYRRELEAEAREKGPDALFSRLEELDPETAAVTERQNVRRVIRALEMIRAGTPKSAAASPDYGMRRLREDGMRLFALDWEKDALESRIRLRVDRMMEKGFLDEVRGLLERGCTPDLPAMQTLGYKELASYLTGGIPTLEEAVEAIKIHTRQYAKKQRTWLRRETRFTWLRGEDLAGTEERERWARRFRETGELPAMKDKAEQE